MSASTETSVAFPQWKRHLSTLGATIAVAAFFYVGSTRDIATADQAICMIVFAAATLSSVAGFAFSALASPMLLLVVTDTLQLVQIMLVSSIALQAYSLFALRKHITVSILLPYMAGGLLALPCGLYLLLHTPLESYLLGVGVFLIVYSLYALLPKSLVTAPARSTLAMQALVGALGGLTGPVAALPGVPITIWSSRQGWDKQRQRALYQPYILFMQIVTLLALQAVSGPGRAQPWLIQYVPPALAGAYIGLRLFKALTTDQFNRVVNAFLLLAGAALIVKAI